MTPRPDPIRRVRGSSGAFPATPRNDELALALLDNVNESELEGMSAEDRDFEIALVCRLRLGGTGAGDKACEALVMPTSQQATTGLAPEVAHV